MNWKPDLKKCIFQQANQIVLNHDQCRHYKDNLTLWGWSIVQVQALPMRYSCQMVKVHFDLAFGSHHLKNIQ